MSTPNYGRERPTPSHVLGHDNPTPIVTGPIHRATGSNANPSPHTGQYADYRMAVSNELAKLTANAKAFAAEVKADQAKRASVTPPVKPLPVSKKTPVPKHNK